MFAETSYAAVMENLCPVVVKAQEIKKKAFVLLEGLNFEHLASDIKRAKGKLSLIFYSKNHKRGIPSCAIISERDLATYGFGLVFETFRFFGI